MADLTIWHNQRARRAGPRRTSSTEAGVEFEERRYLEAPPTADELDEVLTALGKEPWDIARMGEDVAKELDLQGRAARPGPLDRADGGQPDPHRAADHRHRATAGPWWAVRRRRCSALL